MKEDFLHPVYDNGKLHVKISSGNTKMGNIPSFSTLPSNELLTLKDGRVLTNIIGTCGDLCEDCKDKCYAIDFAKRHHHVVIPAYAINTILLRHDPDKLRREIREYCEKNIVKFFRFHTAGELETVAQLELYAQICRDTPDVTFYIYTRACDLLLKWVELLQTKGEEVPSNFVINLSEWNGNLAAYMDKPFFKDCNVFIYDEKKNYKGVHCPATDKAGHETGITCAQCRRCMKKGHITAVYPH
jgi:hypothetical protein